MSLNNRQIRKKIEQAVKIGIFNGFDIRFFDNAVKQNNKYIINRMLLIVENYESKIALCVTKTEKTIKEKIDGFLRYLPFIHKKNWNTFFNFCKSNSNKYDDIQKEKLLKLLEKQ